MNNWDAKGRLAVLAPEGEPSFSPRRMRSVPDDGDLTFTMGRSEGLCPIGGRLLARMPQVARPGSPLPSLVLVQVERNNSDASPRISMKFPDGRDNAGQFIVHTR